MSNHDSDYLSNDEIAWITRRYNEIQEHSRSASATDSADSKARLEALRNASAEASITRRSLATKIRNEPTKSDREAILEHAAVYGYLEPDAKFKVLADWIADWHSEVKERGLLNDGFVNVSPVGGGKSSSVFLAEDTHGNGPAVHVVLKIPCVEAARDQYAITEETVHESNLLTLNAFAAEIQTGNQYLPSAFVKIHRRCIPKQDGIDAALSHLRFKPIYFSMEYVPGKTLRQKLQDQQAIDGTCSGFPLCDVVPWMNQIAEACKHLHRVEINRVHRDLKPENILLDRLGYIRIGDLGISTDRSTDLFKSPKGTPPYMSPNQLEAKAARSSDDVWSWGVLFYELLTGQRPFKGKTTREITQSQQVKPESISSLVDIPKSVGDLIDRCIDPKSSNLPKSFAPIQEVLEPVLNSLADPCIKARNALIDFNKQQAAQRIEGLLGMSELLSLGFREEAGLSVPYRSPWGERVNFNDIDECFRLSRGSLLIVGEAGSGKTFSLLRLTQVLAEHASNDPLRPVPVYLQLPLFYLQHRRAAKISPLDAVTRLLRRSETQPVELPTAYEFTKWIVSQIQDQRGCSWFSEGNIAISKIVLCADGLDEIPEEYQHFVVQELNCIVNKWDLNLVSACRTEPYRNLRVKGVALNVNLAISISPLTPEQVRDCLLKSGVSVYNAFLLNPGIQDLAATPLGLSVLSRTYAGVTGDLRIVKIRGRNLLRHAVLEDFVDRMQQRAERRKHNVVCDNHTSNDIPPENYRFEPGRLRKFISWIAVNGHEHFHFSEIGKPFLGGPWIDPVSLAAMSIIIFIQTLLMTVVISPSAALSPFASPLNLAKLCVNAMMLFAILAAITKPSKIFWAGTIAASSWILWDLLYACFFDRGSAQPWGILWLSVSLSVSVVLMVVCYNFWSPLSWLGNQKNGTEQSNRIDQPSSNRWMAIAHCGLIGWLGAAGFAIAMDFAADVFAIDTVALVMMAASVTFVAITCRFVTRDLSDLACGVFIAGFAIAMQILPLGLTLGRHFLDFFAASFFVAFCVIAAQLLGNVFASSLVAAATLTLVIAFGRESLAGTYAGVTTVTYCFYLASKSRGGRIATAWSMVFDGRLSKEANRLIRGPLLSICSALRFGLGFRAGCSPVKYCTEMLILKADSHGNRSDEYTFAHRVFYEHFQKRDGYIRLQSSEKKAQLEAVRQLAKFRSGSLLREIWRGDYPREVRALSAFHYVMQYESMSIKTDLVAVVEDADYFVRRAAVLGGIGASDKIKQEIAQSFANDESVIVQLALSALAEIEFKLRFLAPISRRIQIYECSKTALFEVPKSAKSAVDEIFVALDDEMSEIRKAAVQAIYHANELPSGLFERLVDCLQDSNESVVVEAMRALGKHGGDDVLPQLSNFLLPWKRETFRNAAAYSLVQLGTARSRSVLRCWHWTFGSRVRMQLITR